MPSAIDSAEIATLVLVPEDTEAPADRFGPLRGASARVYLSLRKAILDGELGFGTALSEDAIAGQLGVSRTPVREALQNLAREGILEPGPRRTLLVRQPTPELCDEVLTMRIALECESVVRACEVAADEDIDQIKLTIFRQERECRREATSAFLEADGNFHFEIARSAKLPLLHKTLVGLHSFSRLISLKALQTKGRMKQVIDEHERVLNALELRDPEAARAAMKQHLESTGQVLGMPVSRARGKRGQK
jgi:GntR family transcriptional regulator, rspAB operon transcriptional repressor